MRSVMTTGCAVLALLLLTTLGGARTQAQDTAAPGAPAAASQAPAAADAAAPSLAGVIAAEAPPAPVQDVFGYKPRDYVPLAALTPEGSVQFSDEVAFQSLLFTSQEVSTIVGTLSRSARVSGANRPGRGLVGGPFVIPGEEAQSEAEAKPYYPPIPTKRMISLSGVVYRSPGDWIVWLNGHKLTPGVKLPELVDIKVENDRVHLKWFDIGMAKIIAITLRPRQTYDITSGVLLTSSTAEGR